MVQPAKKAVVLGSVFLVDLLDFLFFLFLVLVKEIDMQAHKSNFKGAKDSQ